MTCQPTLSVLLASVLSASFAFAESPPVVPPPTTPAPAPADPAWVAPIKAALGGQPGVYKDAVVKKEAVAETQAKIWAAYKAAAVELGWDKTLAPMPPTLEDFVAMTPEERQKNRVAPSTLPCDAETMPYFLLAKGKPGSNGWPLFFQTHGGGSTDEKLSGPHGWNVNTQDWQAQCSLFQHVLPPGLYFIPRMANDNKGRWWYKHNMTAFDKAIRCSILFRNADPDRIYMMGISEGAYGTEALTPFWADRFAGGCAMAGGSGAGERLYCLRNTAFRNDTGENDTMYGRADLVQKEHAYLDELKKADPAGYDHMLNMQKGRGHGIDYKPGPDWIATKVRQTRPTKVCWYNFALDGVRRTDFSWLALSEAPDRDALIIAEADKATNTITLDARMNPEGQSESPVYAAPALHVKDRLPLAGGDLVIFLDDQLVDMDKPVKVMLNGKQVFLAKVTRSESVMADTTARFGDPGRVFSGKITLKLPVKPAPATPAAKDVAPAKP